MFFSSSSPSDARRKRPRAYNLPTPGFRGERHGVIQLPAGGFGSASFMGPGTQLLTRLRRGDRAQTPIDKISMLHDIEYGLARDISSTQQEADARSRAADLRMVRNGWQAVSNGNETLFNGMLGAGLISAKIFLEDMGVLEPNKFVGKATQRYIKNVSKRDAADLQLLLSHRKRLLCGSGPAADAAACTNETESLPDKLPGATEHP